MDDLLYQIALTFVPGVGPVLARNLFSYCGSAIEVFKSPKKKLLQIPGIGPKMAAAICNHSNVTRAEQEISFLQKNKFDAIFYTSSKYPKRLKNCVDSPLMLYHSGNTDFNNQRVISIVGTRNCTPYGRQLTEELVDHLKKLDVLVISGLAYGIDVACHKACLKNNVQTLGVLGHGLDRLYPSQHRSVAEKMKENGGLITDFPSQTNPDRENFPKRNRIVAGMADATIVIEASVKGGALITAEIANSYNRDVFTFPGRIGDVYSEGCNFLVRYNKAGLLTGYEDLVQQLGWAHEQKDLKKQQLLFPLDLSPEETKIFEQLKNQEQIGVDDLAIKTNLPLSILAMNLLNLEMQGLVRALPGKAYKIIS